MAFDFNLTRIDNTDTFKEWADKCNEIIDGLNSTDFVTSSEGLLTLASNQTITGQKSFTQSATLTRGFTSTGTITSTGNFTLGGTTGIINAPTFQINSGTFTTGSGFEVIGASGIGLKSSSTSSVASLKFENAGTPEKLQFDYSGAGEGIFEIADGNKLALAGSSPTIGVNNYEWDLPATSPGVTPSLLKWSGTGSQLEWLGQSSFATSILADVIAALQQSNFTLPVTLIPVGTMVAVDARILDNWPETLNGLSSPENYGILNTVPGWIPCAGQTLSFDDTENSPIDTEFKELIELLEGIDSPNGSTTLPDTIGSPGEEDPIGGNAIVYLIKYKSDDTTSFAVSTTTGVAGASGINLFDTSNAEVGFFDITGGKIGLNINTDDFAFGVGGKLELVEEIDTAATANTLAKRDSAGTLSVATPTEDAHATTKAFVDSALTKVRVYEDSVKSFAELIDGHQSYFDNQMTVTMVDRDGRGRVIGINNQERHGTSQYRNDKPDGWFAAISPITNQEAIFKRSFANHYNFFFIDEDDVLYGSGRNISGEIGQQSRGTTAADDFIDYYSEFNSFGEQPYNDTAVETPNPAMLPQKSSWPANAVTVDTVTYTNEESQPGIIIKTKDGIGNEYVSGNRLNGLERYETSSAAVAGAGVPYTRGWVIGITNATYGTLGTGSTAKTSYDASGPLVYGLNSAGSGLWATFGLTDTERAAGISSLDSDAVEKVNKRFHYYKSNATLKGGLDDTDDATALAAWKTELGLTGSETFDQYSYYIKKSVINAFTSWHIIGKPGNENDNELWFAGWNGQGQGGNGDTDSFVMRHVPALDSGTTLDSAIFLQVVTGTSNKVFRSAAGTGSGEANVDHGFEDFERLKFNNRFYYIIRGDENNANLSSHFRLFIDETRAYNALAEGGTTSAYPDASIGNRTVSHLAKLKGMFDISVGATTSTNSSAFVLARRTVNTPNSATELDALSETDITGGVTVMSWGQNDRGQLGRGAAVNTRSPGVVSLGTDDRPVDIIAISSSDSSFVITENTDGNRSIRHAGDADNGLADREDGSLSSRALHTAFTLSTTIDANWWVEKVFVSSGAYGANAGSIFIVAESKGEAGKYALFAGGSNTTGRLGTGKYFNSTTRRYIRVPFPEDPKNIVAIQTSRLVSSGGGNYVASFAIAKTAVVGETEAEFAAKPGRSYGAGIATYFLGAGSGQQVDGKADWHPIEAQVLSS